MAGEQLTCIATMTIKEGATEAFVEVARECCAAVAADEPGNVAYEYYLDGDTCRVVEIYADSAALVQHIKGTLAPELMAKLTEHSTLESFECYGEPTGEARAILERTPGSIIRGRPVCSAH